MKGKGKKQKKSPENKKKQRSDKTG